MMRKSLRRVLDRLRSAAKESAAKGKLREGTSIRGGLQEPQRIEALPAPVRVRS
jgi:hypothetical protein